jgi:hypothetical protein
MITIGVTGHRILAELDAISKGIDAALDHIEKSFPEEGLAVMSTLAEGADRLVAHRVLLRPNAKLIAPLPFPKADYETDFKAEGSKAEFRELLSRAAEVVHLKLSKKRDEAYEAAGRYVLDHSDVLLAVWDGRDAQGRGGTGEIVSHARERDLPIAWVHAGNRKAGTNEPTTLGDDQGRVTFENF